MEKRFLLVDTDILPEVFRKVIKAKELIANGKAKNVSAAVKQVDLSRSAFYKYKDSIFSAENERELLNITAVLRDETGALGALLLGISNSGASVATINQAPPENGTAKVIVSIRTSGMQITLENLLAELSAQRDVIEVRKSLQL